MSPLIGIGNDTMAANIDNKKQEILLLHAEKVCVFSILLSCKYTTLFFKLTNKSLFLHKHKCFFFGSTNMFHNKGLSQTPTTHSMVSRKIWLHEYIPQQRRASMPPKHIPLDGFSQVQESIAKTPIAAIST